ncbi:YceI family protein [Emticicia sp.]|uniref:YceI family protein n=1 Tax=Emticicia sp. TaxID=1930953 RepID=UPI0037526EA4
MKVVKNLMIVALAALVSVSAMADGGKAVAPVALKVDAKASTFNWLGKKFTGEHNGTIGVQNGSLVVNGGKLSGGEFTIDMKSIKCLDLTDAGYNAKLIGHLTSPDFFDVAKYPTATLKIKKAIAKTATNYDITGDLTINGVTQSITFPAVVTIAKGATTATAKFEVDRTKFGSKYNSKSFFDTIGDKMINDNFQVDVKIVASK